MDIVPNKVCLFSLSLSLSLSNEHIRKTWPLRILATRTTEPLAALSRFGPESRLMLLIVGTSSPSCSTLYCPVHYRTTLTS